MRDLTYPPIIVAAKTAFRLLGQKFDMTGTEHVPRTGGVLLAVNHVGYVDFIYGGLAANPSGRKVRFMSKRELFDHKYTGPLMRSLHHIEVDRGEGLAWLYGIARHRLMRSIEQGRVEDRARRKLALPRLEVDDDLVERIEAATWVKEVDSLTFALPTHSRGQIVMARPRLSDAKARISSVQLFIKNEPPKRWLAPPEVVALAEDPQPDARPAEDTESL